MRKKTLYEVLGVPENASPEAMRLALDAIENSVVRPTADAGVGDAENRLKFAHQAFSILSHPASRAQYDERLKRERELSAQISAASDQQQLAAARIKGLGPPDQISSEPTAARSAVSERVDALAVGLKSGPNSRLYMFGGVLFLVGFVAALGIMAIRGGSLAAKSEPDGPTKMAATDRTAARADQERAELAAIRDEAISTVKGELVDPFSAHFRGLYHYPGATTEGRPTTIVCGEVNAKNKFGGYVGWKEWIYVDGSAYLDGPEGDVSTILAGTYLKLCRANEDAREYLPTD